MGRCLITTRGGSIALILLTLVFGGAAFGEELKFPAPEFQSGYTFPATTTPAPTATTRDWVDLTIFTGALSLAAWLAVRRRSRRAIFWLMLFSLAYFGFYKQGCVCPIGSTQNVALSLLNPHYAVPLTVALFFVLPLLFSLFFGRVFCSSVCALGAIQDLVVIKPIRLPKNLTTALSVIPYAYLGLAVLLAIVNTSFLICRFDPFIGFFRLGGNLPYLLMGGAFLLIGMFVARPYCRFFCPYGALLGLMSRFSRRHVSITPTNCVNCRLCEVSCPFDYIHKPNLEARHEVRGSTIRRLAYLLVMTPVLMALGGFVGFQLAPPLSHVNRTVGLAEQMMIERTKPSLKASLETDAFRAAGTPLEELYQQADVVRRRMRVGATVLGGFVGLILGLKLIGVSIFRQRTDYEIDKASCFSCARCCSYCPNDASHNGRLKQSAVLTSRTQKEEPVCG